MGEARPLLEFHIGDASNPPAHKRIEGDPSTRGTQRKRGYGLDGRVDGATSPLLTPLVPVSVPEPTWAEPAWRSLDDISRSELFP